MSKDTVELKYVESKQEAVDIINKAIKLDIKTDVWYRTENKGDRVGMNLLYNPEESDIVTVYDIIPALERYEDVEYWSEWVRELPEGLDQ